MEYILKILIESLFIILPVTLFFSWKFWQKDKEYGGQDTIKLKRMQKKINIRRYSNHRKKRGYLSSHSFNIN